MFIMFHLYHVSSTIGASKRALLQCFFQTWGCQRGRSLYVSIIDYIIKASKDSNCSKKDHKPSPSTCCIIKSFCNHTKTLLTQKVRLFLMPVNFTYGSIKCFLCITGHFDLVNVTATLPKSQVCD